MQAAPERFLRRRTFFNAHPGHCNGRGCCPACGYPTLIDGWDDYCSFCEWECSSLAGWCDDLADQPALPNDHTLAQARWLFEENYCVWHRDEQNDFSPQARWSLFSTPVRRAKQALQASYDRLLTLSDTDLIARQWQHIDYLINTLPSLMKGALQTYPVALEWQPGFLDLNTQPPSRDLFFQPRLRLCLPEVDPLLKRYQPSMLPFAAGEALRDKWAADDFVWDLDALVRSARRPGAYYLLNCSCGIPSDSEITEPILVSHPNKDKVNWDIDLQGYRHWWLAESDGRKWPQIDGYITLRFDRAQYEAALFAMLEQVESSLSAHPEIDEIYPQTREMGAYFDDYQPWVNQLRTLLSSPRQPALAGAHTAQLNVANPYASQVIGANARCEIHRLCSSWTSFDVFRRWCQDTDPRQEATDQAESEWLVAALIQALRSELRFSAESASDGSAERPLPLRIIYRND